MMDCWKSTSMEPQVGQAYGARGQAVVGQHRQDKNGVVSVTSLLADRRVYWPIVFEPYTLAHHFAEGKADPKFRTKLKIAAQRVEQGIVDGIRFRVVVAYSFYGEEEDFKRSLSMFSVASRASQL
jgi:SRSO17 transposase